MKRTLLVVLATLLVATSGCKGFPNVELAKETERVSTETQAPTQQQSTATSAPQRIPTASAILYADYFSDSNSWLGEFEGQDVVRHYLDGQKHFAYQFEVLAEDHLAWVQYPQLYSDVSTSISVLFVDPVTDGSVLLACRYADQNNYYGFEFRKPGGHYEISKLVDGEKFILLEGKIENIQRAGATSFLMTAYCNGTHLIMGMNGELLAEVYDTSLSEGTIAIGVKSRHLLPLVVAFDYLEIGQP